MNKLAEVEVDANSWVALGQKVWTHLTTPPTKLTHSLTHITLRASCDAQNTVYASFFKQVERREDEY